MALTWRTPALMLLGIGAVWLRPEPSTAWWWLLGVVVLVLLDLVLAPSLRSVTVRREPTGPTRLHESTSTVLRLRNDGRRRLRGALRDAWQPSAGALGNRHRLDVRPRETAVFETLLVPTRRGNRTTDRITLRSLGPLRLAARQQTIRSPGSLLVLPAFPSRKHLPSRLSRLRELDGRAAIRIRGAGTEFDSLRDYVRGDDVRSIDWRATARTRSVVVRTWQPERDRRVVIVVDAGRLSAGRVDGVPRLDAAMDTALLLASLATRAGDRVDFVIGDREVRAQVRGRRQTSPGSPGSPGANPVATIQEAMTRVEPMLTETSWSAMAGAVSALGRHRGLVVLITPVEPSAVEQSLLPVLGPLTARHRVVVASVRDPALAALAGSRQTIEQTYAAAAAEQALAQRDRTSRMLGSLGVEVIDEDADRLPPRLADHYLALKARGLL